MRHGLFACRCLVFALLTGMSVSLFAADETVTEQAYLQDFPVVLTASRLAQHISEAPNAVTVIDRQMIKASGFRTIADLFRLVPGMYVGNAGASTPFVSLNGVTDQYSRRMQVLVDGRSVYLPPFGGVDWQDLPVFIDDIERIEVVRGPAAASHGSNSFYGVINILTRDAASLNHKSVTVNKGEMGISDVSARMGRSGEKFDYRISFGYRSDGGDNPRELNDTSSNHLLNLRTNYRPLTSDSIEFQLGISDGAYGQGTLGRSNDAFRDVQIKNDFQQMAWTHSWDSGDESKLTYYRINRDYSDPHKCVDFLLCAVPPQGFAYDVARSQRQELELQNTSQLGTSNRAVWGAGIRYDYANQPLIFATSHGLHQSRVFVHDEWRATESALFNVGTMYEDDGAGHTSTSPRLSLNYHVTPQHTVRTLISAATRNPMMAEMYLQTGTNKYFSRAYTPPAAGLRPERILSKELGYVGQFGALSLDGRIYYDKVRDIIFLDYYADLSNLADPKNSFKNLSDSTFKGLDISASYRWEEGRVTANYSRQQTSCVFSSYPTQYFNPLIPPGSTISLGQQVALGYQVDYLNLCSESVPTHSGNLLLEQHLSESVQFSTGIYLRGRVRVTDVASGFPPESPLRRVDMRIAKSFGNKDEAGGGEVAVIVQNAFQDNSTGYGNVPQRVNLLFKRRAYLTATINF